MIIRLSVFEEFYVNLQREMKDTETYYADVMLPLHVPDTYTYRVPQEYVGAVAAGMRVVVQFGQQRTYSGIVRRLHTTQPKWRTKYILGLLDEQPVVTETQMQLWEWLARYYMCYLGDVVAVALPAGMKLASETAVAISPEFDGELGALTKYERQVVDMLSTHTVMRIDDIGLALGLKKTMPLVRTMVERNIVVVDEELRGRGKPATITLLRVGDQYRDEAAMQKMFDDLERSHAPKQVAVLLQFLQASKMGREAVAKSELPHGTPLKALIDKGILNETEVPKWKYENGERRTENGRKVSDIVLNEEQQKALIVCSGDWVPTLLHGVTGSGKTEVYIKLIDSVIREGRQALLMVPEIALTSQVIERMRDYFGDAVGVYHSRLSSSERIEVWYRTLSDGDRSCRLIVGARSALLLPFRNLGLIIVDEEHDRSYKQEDPAPRYNARDAAVYLANSLHIPIVLGSATPSIESYHNAESGRYRMAVMKHRFGEAQMPHIELVDMRGLQREQLLSPTLRDAIAEALGNGQQVILFQNRRGFSPHIECDDCHHIPQCINCDLSLVYHKDTGKLKCHSCGYSIPLPQECPNCHSHRLRLVGIGTQRVEEDLQITFPDAKVARMDLDTTLAKNSYETIISDFQHHRIDILVGTQMVTKGLDFKNVAVVGVIGADGIINYPDFRSHERAFQQLTQVSGRAGRSGGDARVIIQTHNPSHQLLLFVVDNDYKALYDEQILERSIFRYPPFYRLVQVTLRHRQTNTLDTAAAAFAASARCSFGGRVIGPEYPIVSRIRAMYIKTITIRFERTEPIASAKEILHKIADDVQKIEGCSNVNIHFDVDPY